MGEQLRALSQEALIHLSASLRQLGSYCLVLR